MTDFFKIAKSVVVHFAHICAYGVETVKRYLKPRRERGNGPTISLAIFSNGSVRMGMLWLGAEEGIDLLAIWQSEHAKQ